MVTPGNDKITTKMLVDVGGVKYRVRQWNTGLVVVQTAGEDKRFNVVAFDSRSGKTPSDDVKVAIAQAGASLGKKLYP